MYIITNGIENKLIRYLKQYKFKKIMITNVAFQLLINGISSMAYGI